MACLPGMGARMRTSGAGHGVGDVLVQAGDPGHLHARAELELVAGDGGADDHADQAGLRRRARPGRPRGAGRSPRPAGGRRPACPMRSSSAGGRQLPRAPRGVAGRAAVVEDDLGLVRDRFGQVQDLVVVVGQDHGLVVGVGILVEETAFVDRGLGGGRRSSPTWNSEPSPWRRPRARGCTPTPALRVRAWTDARVPSTKPRMPMVSEGQHRPRGVEGRGRGPSHGGAEHTPRGDEVGRRRAPGRLALAQVEQAGDGHGEERGGQGEADAEQRVVRARGVLLRSVPQQEETGDDQGGGHEPADQADDGAGGGVDAVARRAAPDRRRCRGRPARRRR